jgi:fructokinase
MRVLSFGEILWDIINGEEHLGGAPFNFAAHSAQCGNESMIISRLGSDYLGMRAYNRSKTFGVDPTFIQWDEVYPTGLVDITLVNGQPDYNIRENVAYDFIAASTATALSNAKPIDVFYFGSLAQRSHVSQNALKNILATYHFGHIFYDVNLRKGGFNESIVRGSLKACSVFKLNADEVPVISEMICGTLLSSEEFCKAIKALFPNISLIIITASERGCFIFRENDLVYVPGTPVKVNDAVGAGDAFSASFMHVYASTGDALMAAQIANQVGAYVATKAGAIPGYSSEVKDMLYRNSKKIKDTMNRIL